MIPLYIRKHKGRSRNSGGGKAIVTIVTRVDIREPHVGSSVQSRIISFFKFALYY